MILLTVVYLCLCGVIRGSSPLSYVSSQGGYSVLGVVGGVRSPPQPGLGETAPGPPDPAPLPPGRWGPALLPTPPHRLTPNAKIHPSVPQPPGWQPSVAQTPTKHPSVAQRPGWQLNFAHVGDRQPELSHTDPRWRQRTVKDFPWLPDAHSDAIVFHDSFRNFKKRTISGKEEGRIVFDVRGDEVLTPSGWRVIKRLAINVQDLSFHNQPTQHQNRQLDKIVPTEDKDIIFEEPKLNCCYEGTSISAIELVSALSHYNEKDRISDGEEDIVQPKQSKETIKNDESSNGIY